MENFAVNAIYERNESGERSAEDEKWWFNSNRTNEDFPLKRKEQEVVTRTHISRVESQIRMEKISRSSSMCDYDEECERMDCNEEEEDDDEDDDSLLAVEDLKSSLTTLQEQKNTKATTTKRKRQQQQRQRRQSRRKFQRLHDLAIALFPRHGREEDSVARYRTSRRHVARSTDKGANEGALCVERRDGETRPWRSTRTYHLLYLPVLRYGKLQRSYSRCVHGVRR